MKLFIVFLSIGIIGINSFATDKQEKLNCSVKMSYDVDEDNSYTFSVPLTHTMYGIYTVEFAPPANYPYNENGPSKWIFNATLGTGTIHLSARAKKLSGWVMKFSAATLSDSDPSNDPSLEYVGDSETIEFSCHPLPQEN